MHTVTLIPGDGVGPEITEVTKRCIESTGVDIKWDEVQAGAEVMDKYGTPLPDEVIEAIKRNRVAIKGPITTPIGKGFRSVNVSLRKILNLYVCLRPCKLYPGVCSNYTDVDLVIVRENTEDLYAGIEFAEGEILTRDLIDFIKDKTGINLRYDTAISIKPISLYATERIVKFAFEYARKNNRKKVTAVHKANIMKYTDGLFLEVAREVAEKYPDIEFEDRIVDNMCMQLVQKPQIYDVIVAPNLYGDIISDLCAGLVGGLGVAPGANLGEDLALFEPTHGSAPKYKNQNKVNPTAMILSGVMMLRFLSEDKAAESIEKAVADVIAEGKFVTYDLKRDKNSQDVVGTIEMAEAIIKRIESNGH